jgi:hypothetical protein
VTVVFGWRLQGAAFSSVSSDCGCCSMRQRASIVTIVARCPALVVSLAIGLAVAALVAALAAALLTPIAAVCISSRKSTTCVCRTVQCTLPARQRSSTRYYLAACGWVRREADGFSAECVFSAGDSYWQSSTNRSSGWWKSLHPRRLIEVWSGIVVLH